MGAFAAAAHPVAKALASGVIKVPKDAAGLPVKTRLRDNGTSANDPADQASFIFLTGSEDDCILQEDLPLFDLVNGQVRIEN